jgi:hypothetical protein
MMIFCLGVLTGLGAAGMLILLMQVVGPTYHR